MDNASKIPAKIRKVIDVPTAGIVTNVGTKVPIMLPIVLNAPSVPTVFPLSSRLLTEYLTSDGVTVPSKKLATTSSTGGLLLALQRAIVTARPKGRYRKHFCWPAIKRYYSNLLVSILLLALLYTFELLHLLYCQSFQHNIL